MQVRKIYCFFFLINLDCITTQNQALWNKVRDRITNETKKPRFEIFLKRRSE